jgi:plastocyanin
MKPTVRFAAFLAVLLLAVAAAHSEEPQTKAQKVAIKNLKFEPGKVTIKVGQSVIWTNKDDHDHTVVAKNGSFESENLVSGDSFKHTFAKAGKYEYFCRYHPRMKGTVTVED